MHSALVEQRQQPQKVGDCELGRTLLRHFCLGQHSHDQLLYVQVISNSAPLLGSRCPIVGLEHLQNGFGGEETR